jgi:hypothetical protein
MSTKIKNLSKEQIVTKLGDIYKELKRPQIVKNRTSIEEGGTYRTIHVDHVHLTKKEVKETSILVDTLEKRVKSMMQVKEYDARVKLKEEAAVLEKMLNKKVIQEESF